jgi:hypothetical protein
MATVNLGRIKPVFRGAYNNSTSYVVDDIVTFGNETFIAIQAGSGNATSNASYWTKLAAKGADGTDVAATLANKEISFKTNAGALDGIPIGTAGQALKVNSGATGYEFGTAGGILQLKHNHITGTQSIGNGTSTASGIDITNSEISLTPSSASNKIFICTSLQLSGANDLSCKIMRKIGSGSYANILLNSQRGSETLAHVSNTNRDNHEMSPNNIQLLDAPNTTSQVYYKAVAFNGPEGGGGGYVNRPGATSTSLNQETVISTITIMEIASGIL